MPKRRPTTEIADPNIKSGKKPYHLKAKLAISFLLGKVQTKELPVTYSELAAILQYSNPRNCNFPLGSIGKAIMELSESTGENIPPLTGLVVRQDTMLPSQGVAGFFDNQVPKEQEIEHLLRQVYIYPKWGWVAKEIAAVSIP